MPTVGLPGLKNARILKQVFEVIGEPAKAEKCPAIEGITKEHDEFMSEENPSPAVCDMFLTGSGARAEHYEIAAYNGLITMAQALGEKDAVPLLQENLKQEEAALASWRRPPSGSPAQTPSACLPQRFRSPSPVRA